MSTMLLLSWYLSGFAIFVYIVLITALIAGIYSWQKRAINNLREEFLAKEAKDNDLEMSKEPSQDVNSESEVVETLKAQLKSKTIELAAKAKESELRNELIIQIQKHIEGIKENPKSTSRVISKMDRLLKDYDTDDDNMFEIQMDELHQEMFKTLKSQYEGLTSNDLRLCAYIKNGFNSKEIADLFNIKPSSVYISRSRLRKKLDLDADADLYDFLQSI